MKVVIRQIAKQDNEDVNELCRQLGYKMPLSLTLQNINDVIGNKHHDAFVATVNNKVVGWIGVSQSLKIEMPPYCEIHGLVVDSNYHGQGIGKKLIEKAKEWAKEKGNSKLSLHCNIKRTESLLFYEHLGFHEVKQQKFLEIEI